MQKMMMTPCCLLLPLHLQSGSGYADSASARTWYIAVALNATNAALLLLQSSYDERLVRRRMRILLRNRLAKHRRRLVR